MRNSQTARARAVASDDAKAASVLVVDPAPTFEISPYMYMQFMEPLGATDAAVEAAWNYDADDWRKDFIDQLVGEGRALRLVDAMQRMPGVGIVGPAAHILPVSEYMGANGRDVGALALRMGASLQPADPYHFVSGSMFLARLSALRPLLELDLFESEFIEERGQIDGTMAHAVERSFGISSAVAGYLLESAEQLLGEPTPTACDYAYAGRS
jgi:hypothetical protein